MKRLSLILIGAALFSASPALAEKCTYNAANECIQNVITVDQTGAYVAPGGGGSSGSVTAAGTNGTTAQAVQGITGGVPVSAADLDALAPPGFPSTLSATGTFGSGTNGWIDTTGYKSISVQITGTFVATVNYEFSNDASTAVGAVGTPPNNPGTFADAAADQTPLVRNFPVTARYFRVRVSPYTSGSIVATVYLRSSAYTPRSGYISGGTIVATPLKSASTVVAGTVAAANTFQTALASSTTRNGCNIVNTSANLEYVYVGGGTAAVAASYPIAANGGLFNCASPAGVVITDLLTITSATVSSSYLVVSQ